jgi:hypothetical protein
MKDLYVFTADADALAVIRSVLARPLAIGIRPVTFKVNRHTGRDPGMVRSGPELARMRVPKTAFEKLVLIWDHKGSGWEEKPPDRAREEIQIRLNQVTWEDRSEAVAVVPEIEEWLWHSPASLGGHLKTGLAQLNAMVQDFASKRNLDCSTCKLRYPKEVFEEIFYRLARRKPLPRDFEQIAMTASLDDWQTSQTFGALVNTLRRWFPE